MKSNLKHLTKTEEQAIEKFVELMRAGLRHSLVKLEIFGSKIKGDYTEDSDIDILIIVRERTLGIMDRVAEITTQLNIEYAISISPTVFSEYEHRVNIDMKSPFSLCVETEGVRL